MVDPDPIVARLLCSGEPSIRWLTLRGVFGLTARDPAVAAAAAAVPESDRVQCLLSERVADGTLPFHPYNAKWRGAHWVLVALAELGYPAGDESLVPLREQALDWVLSHEYERRHMGRVRDGICRHCTHRSRETWSGRYCGWDWPTSGSTASSPDCSVPNGPTAAGTAIGERAAACRRSGRALSRCGH